MTFRPVLDALAIPAEAAVNKRVPKTLLLEQDAVRTAADSVGYKRALTKSSGSRC